SILLVNAVAILSEDRFLARSTFIPPFQPATGYYILNQAWLYICGYSGLKNQLRVLTSSGYDIVGWGSTPTEPAFGGSRDEAASVKGKLVNLISSVRTLMRSELFPRLSHFLILRLSETKKGKRNYRLPIADCLVVPLIVINTLIIVYALVLG
ncbi:MAG: hypothetical protein Q9180_009724, partial [Flavoplaca navasiana]